MFGLFKKKPFLPKEYINFQLQTYGWLLRTLGPKYFFERTKLILPTEAFFPAKVVSADMVATRTFETIKQHLGIEYRNFRLVVQSEDINPHVGKSALIQGVPRDPAGTFQIVNGQVIITYKPDLIKNPTNLVATFAHELSHYLTCLSRECPPDGWENWENATDITATFIGFGIFMCNSATNFHQYTNSDSSGWSTQKIGYLSEPEHVFALAIFLLLKEINPSDVKPYLKPALFKLLRRAIKEIETEDYLVQLKSMKPKDRSHLHVVK